MSICVSEVVMVLLVAVLVIKPEKLPDAAYSLGKWLRWLRQTSDKIKHEISSPLEMPTAHVTEEKPHE
ncbi:MAG: twin-arginine translocase TatA/TatE family subunit [Pseudomonadota bacterium]